MTTDPAQLTRASDEGDRRQSFRDAMSAFPSGVTIVTTRDDQGAPWGFTATAFCSVSAEPPLVLVCLAQTAQCYDVFMESPAWMIHIVHAEHQELALRFATRGADKFAGTAFIEGSQLPRLLDAAVHIECSRHSIVDAGDHAILIGRVTDVTKGASSPVVYFDRTFHTLKNARG